MPSDGPNRPIRRAPRSGDVVRRGQARRNPAYDDDDDEGPSAADVERFGDATRACPNCGRDVYDEVEMCPHCGHALSHAPSRAPRWVVVTIVIVIIAFVITFVL